MLNLTVAALFLIGTHLGIASTALRRELVGRLGETLYRALYSLLALVALAWLVVAWRAAPTLPVWSAGAAVRHGVLLLMPLAFLLVIGAVTGPNPTAVGQRPDPDGTPAYGIIRITRHPLMWGIALWAILHLGANGDVAAFLFFGTLALLAILGTFLIDARRTRANDPGWGVFLQATSNLPFLAVLEGRQKIAPAEIGLWRVALALAAYVVLLWLHPQLFGVSPIG